jgi:hypothetical protein
MEYWQQILLALGGNAALLLVLAWLGKSLLSQLLAKDVDKFKMLLTKEQDGFKAALEAEYAAAVEKLKHDLQLVATEHEVMFAKLHEKRANVIAETHRLIREIHLSVLHLSLFLIGDLGEDRPKQDAFEKVMETSGTLYNYFYANCIYLPERLCETLEGFALSVRSEAENFMQVGKRQLWSIIDAPWEERKNRRAEWEQEHGAAWQKSQQFFDDEVPRVKRELERELRRLMGDRQPASAAAAAKPDNSTPPVTPAKTNRQIADPQSSSSLE